MADDITNVTPTPAAVVPAEAPQGRPEQRFDRGGPRGPRRPRRPGGDFGDDKGEFTEKTVFINRSSKVVKGGRRFSFSALIVIGDRQGRVGLGLGKGKEVSEAIRKGGENAKSRLLAVSMKDKTIPHEVYSHFGGAKVLLRPASPGTGLICGKTVRAIVESRHTNSGQVCTSAERVFVHEDVLDSFTKRYVTAVEALKVGDPAGAVDIGPLVSAAQFKKTTAAVELAIKEGAKVVTGGGRPAGDSFKSGYWFAPTVINQVKPRMDIMVEEIFGPVTPILGVSSLDEALKFANESRYGLSAYLFSRDYQLVMKTVNELQFGEIYINRSLGESVHAHHAGFKESGIGGEDGKWGLLRYTQIKTAYHHYG